MFALGAWGYRFFIIGLLVANGWAQYVLWFGNQGLVQWFRTERQLQVSKEAVRVVEERLRRLKAEILLVNKEPLVLEEVARRQLGLVYPDEIVFVFSEK